MTFPSRQRRSKRNNEQDLRFFPPIESDAEEEEATEKKGEE